MKTITKPFDAVQFMRSEREKMSLRLNKMTKQEILAYFKKRNLVSGVKPSAEQKFEDAYTPTFRFIQLHKHASLGSTQFADVVHEHIADR